MQEVVCNPVWLIVCLCEALQWNLWMVQTHVLLWCEQHLHHDVGRCVTEKSFAIQEMGTLASAHCWKWDNFNNLLHAWHQSVFFFFTQEVHKFWFSFATICTEALKIICWAGAQCWISKSYFCWWRGKSILKHVQPAKCPISAVKKKENPHRGRIGITFCEFWSCPCQGLTRRNQWLHSNIKLCHKL